MVLIGMIVFYLVETQLHRFHHKATHQNTSVELPSMDDYNKESSTSKEGDKDPHLHRIHGDKHMHVKEGDSKSTMVSFSSLNSLSYRTYWILEFSRRWCSQLCRWTCTWSCLGKFFWLWNCNIYCCNCP